MQCPCPQQKPSQDNSGIWWVIGPPLGALCAMGLFALVSITVYALEWPVFAGYALVAHLSLRWPIVQMFFADLTANPTPTLTDAVIVVCAALFCGYMSVHASLMVLHRLLPVLWRDVVQPLVAFCQAGLTLCWNSKRRKPL